MRRGIACIAVVAAAALAGAVGAGASAPPVGPLPAGPVSAIQTQRGQVFAIALPARAKGLEWRAARPVNLRVVRPLADADVGPNVVAVYKAVGRGKTRIVYALTRDETPKALKAVRVDVTVR